MKILVDKELYIELLEGRHAAGIYEMVDANRDYLRAWLTFVDNMQEISYAENFVKGSLGRNKEGVEYAFVIINDGRMVGRIGIYKIDMANRTGEIGYWLVGGVQGKGIINQCCKELINYSFEQVALNRLELRCGTGNIKSKAIAERLGFKMEGIIRQGEKLNGKYIDLCLYSLLHSDK